ncbi:alkaline phosphatase PhoX [Halomarina halobia]|uniref:Alkaline phosphatase PhoX n=1 Tax=Halomarina halobia TaxID=3033386 RepID=A0ABD6AAY0_9EURY|nr:alkaline phosphatase PhoX [Halomarina sp. PSR21]
MPGEMNRRGTLKLLATLAAAGAVGTGAAAAGDDKEQGRGIEQDGATLNRFATTVNGAEITGMFVTEEGDFFFNVQHPDQDNMFAQFDHGSVGAVWGLDFNRLPKDFESVQLPRSEPQKERVWTAYGRYQVLAEGRDLTDDGEPLGVALSPDGEELTDATNPDFNGVVPDGEGGYYVFTNWENRPGMVSRMRIEPTGKNGPWKPTESMNVDFRDVEGTWVNCFGTVSPWGTPLTSEENYEHTSTPDWNNPEWDGVGSVENLAEYLGANGDYESVYPNPYRYGYIVEITEPGSDEPTPVKHFTLGRSAHENSVVMPDERTVYTSSDGTGKGFYKFVADEAGDLSAGTLYVARATQDDGRDFNTVGFDLEWVELGHATNDEIESWIAEYDDVTQADYAEGETSYITDAEVEAWANSEADDDRVAFLETRKAGLARGATMEFRKMEGVNIRRDAEPGDYMYMAMSAVTETMSDGEGDIQLRGNEYGAVYRMKLGADYDVSRMEPIVTGGPDANICGGCPYDANPKSNSKACKSCPYNPATEDDEGDSGLINGTMSMAKALAMTGMTELDADNTIANPDNIVVMDDGRVVIGEDTGLHENNMIWVFDAGEA